MRNEKRGEAPWRVRNPPSAAPLPPPRKPAFGNAAQGAGNRRTRKHPSPHAKIAIAAREDFTPRMDIYNIRCSDA